MSALAAFESRHPTFVRAFMFLLAGLAVLKLGSEMHRLTLSTAPNGAIDLAQRYEELHRWFAGAPVYSAHRRLAYPPQAFVVLWPLVGWLSFTAARWLWAAITIVMLAWMSIVLVRESGARSRLDRSVIVLAWLSMNSVGVAIGNGQLILHILPSLMVAATAELVLCGRAHGGVAGHAVLPRQRRAAHERPARDGAACAERRQAYPCCHDTRRLNPEGPTVGLGCPGCL